MNILNSTSACTGCGACALVCKKNCIKLDMNSNGNLTASITEGCVDCGQCVKVCAKFNISNTKHINSGILYSVEAKNDDFALSCTSSGIATKIAEYGIKNGYKIVGVTYNYEKHIAEEVIIDNTDDIEKIKKSKYLQAYTLDAFSKVIELAKENYKNKFIVFGMPCQIVGLKSAIELLGLSNEIIYIDFFCHGVPSYLVWQKYIAEQKEKQNNQAINEINFRDKSEGWHNFIITVNGNKNYAVYDNFYNAFFDNILLNAACFDCNSRKGESKADLRLGDYWGNKYCKNNIGVSACVLLTDKGGELLHQFDNDFNILEEADKSSCFNNQSLDKYDNLGLNKKYVDILKSDIPLKKVIKSYQKELGVKFKIKKTVKCIIYKFPAKLRNKIKEII